MSKQTVDTQLFSEQIEKAVEKAVERAFEIHTEKTLARCKEIAQREIEAGMKLHGFDYGDPLRMQKNLNYLDKARTGAERTAQNIKDHFVRYFILVTIPSLLFFFKDSLLDLIRNTPTN